MAKKYYVVWKGRKTGIYDKWEVCKAQIENFTGAQYKSFGSQTEAETAFRNGYTPNREVSSQEKSALPKNATKPVFPSLAVDAACSGNPGDLEYRGVDAGNGKELFRQGVFKQGTNNIGEFLALVHGLAYLHKNELPYPIYSDSITAISWVTKKKVKTELDRTPENERLFELIERALHWLNNNFYTTRVLKWETADWGEIPADFGRK